MNSKLQEQVDRALDGVVDPCSRFNGSMLSLRELGMLRDVTITADRLRVELFLDDPSCVFVGQITYEARSVLEPVADGRVIEFQIVTDDYWTPERLSPRAQQRLDGMRAQRLKLVSISRKRTKRPDPQTPLVPDSAASR